MNDTSLIGERIYKLRAERGLTQGRLGGLAGISARMVGLIERGERGLTVANVYALAGALCVEPSRLLGKQEHLPAAAARDRGILGIRDALAAPGDLPGMGIADNAEPVPLADLERHVRDGWDLYWQGRFGELAGTLPGLLATARVTEAETGMAARRPLAQAYQQAAVLLVHTGSTDLAWGAARRAVMIAHRGDDPLQHATLGGTASWVLLHQGRLAEAEQAAAAAAALIVPSGKVPAEHYTVYGALLLSAAAPAAAAGRRAAVEGYMAEASVIALRYARGDRLDYNANFGRSQLEMQRAHQDATLGEPAAAIRAAGKVARADLRPISFGALNLDIAHARLMMGKPANAAKAVEALLTAFAISPAWARCQGLWRDSARAAVKAARRGDRAEELAEAAGLRAG